MKRCGKCILPETYPGVSFDDNGICNYCLDYKPFHQHLGKEKLREVLSSRPRKGRYDCVVPLSGGKDSSYILYYVVKELGLHAIAVGYDSGFQTEMARENVIAACERMAVPLVLVSPPSNSQPRLLKEWILLSAKMGELWGPCGGNCEAILRTASIDTARAHGAPFVAWGSSALEAETAAVYVDYKEAGTARDGRLASSLRRSAGRLNVLVHNPSKVNKIPPLVYSYVGYHGLKFDALSIGQRMRLGMPVRAAIRPRFVPPFTNEDPEFVHFFDYVEWDSIRNIETLEKNLGWKHPRGVESRFDCAIHCLANYQHLQMHGISADGVNFCNFVREGRMDRDDALEREQTIAGSVERERVELLERVGIDPTRMPTGS